MDNKIDKFSAINLSVKGNSDCVAGHQIALYAQDGQLMLQIDRQIWPLSAPHLKLQFYHDVRKRQTHFAITSPAGDFAIDYPAWWAELPDFVPVEPKAAGTMLDLPSVKGGNPVAKHGMDQVIDGIEAQKAEDIETLSGFSKAYNG